MDVAGAEVLRCRIAQQEHWRQARSVRLGSQPASDPDGHLLERCVAGVRVYREQREVEVIAGRKALVIRRRRKHLVDGEWHDENIVVAVEGVA